MKRGWQKLSLFLFGLIPIFLGLLFYWAMLPRIELETSIFWDERVEQERLIPPLHTITHHEAGILVEIHNRGWATAYLDLDSRGSFFLDGIKQPPPPDPIDSFPSPPISIPPGSTYEMRNYFEGRYPGQEVVMGIHFIPYGRFDFPLLYRLGIFQKIGWTPAIVLPPGKPETVVLTEEAK